MLNLSKEKVLISLVIITLIALVIGNVVTFATEDVGNNEAANNNTNSAGTVITATRLTNNTTGAVNNTENTAANNTANNTNTNSNTNSNRNTNTNSTNSLSNNTSNSSRNSSSYVNSSLPYAGTSSSIVFIVIALAVSAIYAYKKVKEYDV